MNKKKLHECVEEAMHEYFADLGGHHKVENLFEVFISEIEKPFFSVVMQQTGGNLTRAAKLLGINQGTLRARLKKYGLK